MAASESIFYVYIHRRASDNSIFYIGKGKGRRAWDKNRNNSWWHKVSNAHGFTVEIVFDNLTERDAFSREIDLIAGFRDHGANLVNVTDGGDGVFRGEQASQHGRKLAALGLGIHNHAVRSRAGKIGGKIGGAIVGRMTVELGIGLFAPGQASSAGKKGGLMPWWNNPATGQITKSYESPGDGYVRGSGAAGAIGGKKAGALPHWHNPKTGERRRAVDQPAADFIRGRGKLPQISEGRMRKRLGGE